MTGEHLNGDTYFEAAVGALGRGDTTLAFEQIAVALSFDPTRREWTTFADGLLDPSSKTPVDTPGEYFGYVALRARAAALAGRWSDAIALLFQVVTFRSDVAYLAWLADWASCFKLRELELDTVGPALSEFVQSLQSKGGLVGSSRVNTEHCLGFVRQLILTFPMQEPLEVIEVTLLYRLERTDEAIARGTEHCKRTPSWRRAVTLANAHRRLGNLRLALVAYEDAAGLDSQQVSTYLDIGDVNFQLGDYAAAGAAYSRALERAPNDVWARGMLALTRFRIAPSSTTLEEVRAWEQDPKVGTRIRQLLGTDAAN